MSHSHETVSPVKRAPAEALRIPRREYSIPADAEGEDAAASLKRSYQEMKGRREDHRLGQAAGHRSDSEKGQDFSNRETSSPSHATQCLAKQNGSWKQIMNSKQNGHSEEKGRIKKKIIKIMVQGTLSSHFGFCITTHWHCPVNQRLQLSKIQLSFDGARQGGWS